MHGDDEYQQNHHNYETWRISFLKTYFLCFWVSLPLHSVSPFNFDCPFIILPSRQSIHHSTFIHHSSFGVHSPLYLQSPVEHSCYWLRFLAVLAWLFNVSKQTSLSKEKTVQQKHDHHSRKWEWKTQKVKKKKKKAVLFKHDRTSVHHPHRATPKVHHTWARKGQ